MSFRNYPYQFKFDDSKKPARIYVYFRDAFNRVKEVEISEELFFELVLLNNSIRNIERSEERHKEYRELSEEELVARGAPTAPSAESLALNNLFIEQLKRAFLELPPAQARRYLLKHVVGFSYAEIAQMENCSRNAVKHSLVFAKRNLQRILADRLPITPSNCGKK